MTTKRIAEYEYFVEYLKANGLYESIRTYSFLFPAIIGKPYASLVVIDDDLSRRTKDISREINRMRECFVSLHGEEKWNTFVEWGRFFTPSRIGTAEKTVHLVDKQGRPDKTKALHERYDPVAAVCADLKVVENLYKSL